MAIKTVIIRGGGIRKERTATAAITPGHLVEINPTDATQVRVHSGAGLNAQKAFAFENEVVGKGIDDDYAANDQVLYEVMQRGSEVYALVAASATAITAGDVLESAGDGTLRTQTGGAATDATQRDGVVAYALEDVDNSGGGSPVRIKVEVA